METTGLSELLARIAGEYRAKASIFDIPEKAFRKAFELESESPGLSVMGQRISLPVGPAAGPHSQLAPNLVAAYLAGARAFELKTVQVNDSLEIAKPCIDALDEGHNTEWSTELSLAVAREEYLRGWIAVNLLASIFSDSPGSFFFNMSLGYTLDGIKSPKMDAFIEGMRRPASAPSSSAFWKLAMRDLEAFVASPGFLSAFGPGALAKARALLADFPMSPVHSVTLSTMHGCPPDEIERIGSYLIEEKGLDAFVKLNPTLLGFDAARGILDETLWKDLEIRRDNFERDLQFSDALKLVASLDAKARAAGRRFGIKLSNTLANANTGSFLPGDERYMSGRALFPLTIALAARLAAALPNWGSRFSYCGGAWAKNAGPLVAAGLGPLTIATDILKPGGYLRLLPAARAAVKALHGSPDRPDAVALARLAELALAQGEYRKGWKAGRACIKKPLPLYDCFAAPCVEACPVNQNVPEYIRLGASGASKKALETILADNPMPFITGTLCDHVCQAACCRNDYEGSVEIRSAKLACARSASVPAAPATHGASFSGRGARKGDAKVAIIGAGPAGLSCAQHLALAGVEVTVFDRSREMGGVPANVIPGFRIPREDIAADIERIRGLGAEFRLGAAVDSLDPLRSEGYTAFFIGAGAPVPRKLEVEGTAFPVVDALSFLLAASERIAGRRWEFGEPKRIVVAGGGNTAMDAVRLALRLPGIEEVRLSYRRGREEMPADEEELCNALAEGGKLMELTLPERSYQGPDGPRLSLRVMEKGERDASGRRSPRATDRTESVDCDLLVAAVGESADTRLLEALGIPCGENGRPLVDSATQESRRAGVYVGGDAARGPSSIITAVADGRRAAYAILRAAGIEPPPSRYSPPPPDPDKLASRGEFVENLAGDAPALLARAAERCLNCDSACLRCVEVCPNRANFALPVKPEGLSVKPEGLPTATGEDLKQSIQILHVDALCNECGNCGVFCPYEGEPFRGKPSLFRDRASLEASHNASLGPRGNDSVGSPPRAAPNAGFAFVPRDGDGPSLVLREAPGGPVRELLFAEWSREGSGGTMAALARSVYRDHRYLIGGA
jgi:putative selenate reductase